MDNFSIPIQVDVIGNVDLFDNQNALTLLDANKQPIPLGPSGYPVITAQALGYVRMIVQANGLPSSPIDSRSTNIVVTDGLGHIISADSSTPQLPQPPTVYLSDFQATLASPSSGTGSTSTATTTSVGGASLLNGLGTVEPGSISVGPGSMQYDVPIVFRLDDVGVRTIKAVVDPFQNIPEVNFGDNIQTMQVQVANPYHLVVSTEDPVSGAMQDVSSSGGPVAATPTDLVKGTSKQIPIAIRCEDEQQHAAPAGTCLFSLALTPGTDKGGHLHDDGTPRPLVLQGAEPFLLIEPNATSFTAPLSVDQYGRSLSFVPPEIAGDIVITTTGSDNMGNPLGNPIPVTFHNAILGLNGILENSAIFRLTGSTTDHPQNHFLSDDGFRIVFLANEFADRFKTTLGLNDMSLPLGGKFDLGARNRPKAEPYWVGTLLDGSFSHHFYHRDGHSVDIDRCSPPQGDNPELVLEPCPYVGTNGHYPVNWVKVPKPVIERICGYYNGEIINETPIHCEFHKE